MREPRSPAAILIARPATPSTAVGVVAAVSTHPWTERVHLGHDTPSAGRSQRGPHTFVGLPMGVGEYAPAPSELTIA